MNTQSPLQPLGRLPNSGKPYTNLAVISIVALHVIFFTGLLLQGCRRPKTETAQTPDLGLLPPPTTNAVPATNAFAGYAPPYGATPSPAPTTTNLPAWETSAPTNVPATLPTNLWTGTTSQPTNLVATPEPSPTPAPAAVTEHKIAPGDTPARIARKYGITLDQLREANPNMDERRLRIGHTLRIPTPATRESAALTPAPAEVAAAAPAATIHVVKPGETLTRIAARYGTTVKELRQYNNLKTDRILVDQKLKIPPAPAKAAAPTGTNN
jgi:LysM repeat protein